VDIRATQEANVPNQKLDLVLELRNLATQAKDLRTELRLAGHDLAPWGSGSLALFPEWKMRTPLQ